MPKRGGATSHRRIETALAALAANTRKAYRCAWRAWQSWAAEQGGSPRRPGNGPMSPTSCRRRHEGGAAPATIHVARSAIAKMHQVSGQPDPTADSLCRDLLRRIDREGRGRGRAVG